MRHVARFLKISDENPIGCLHPGFCITLLNSDAVFETLAWEYSIPRPDGIREVWVTGCVHYPPSPDASHC